MDYLLLFSAAVFSGATAIFGNLFNCKNVSVKNAASLYNLLLAVSVLVGWGIFYLCDLSFEPGVLLYSLGYGVCYVTSVVCLLYAMKHGPVALSSLIMNFSLIVVTVWGMIFWNSKINAVVLSGLCLVVISLLLCLYQKKSSQEKLSAKWFFYISIAFFGNTGCVILQKTQQMQYHNQHGNMLMFFAMIPAVAMCALLYLRAPVQEPKKVLCSSGFFPVLAGTLNLLLNLFVILLAAGPLSPSLIYPTTAVGGIAVTSVLSVILFKERLSLRQWFGVAVGGVAIALLSI
ncbi:MAG: EamA family transporter [Clostridia bacterium]|nr:EamA family transporter [Clostridia bacterium]